MFRRPSECKHTFSRAVESDKMQRLPCWCYLKWHSLQWCCFWHDRINEVRYACVISSTCNFLFSNFGFFCHVFFCISFLKQWLLGNEYPKWPSVFLMDGILSVVASLFLLNPTGQSAEMCLGEDPSVQCLWTTILGWVGPVSMHSNPEGSVLKVT